jgi:hypothetical protein
MKRMAFKRKSPGPKAVRVVRRRQNFCLPNGIVWCLLRRGNENKYVLWILDQDLKLFFGFSVVPWENQSFSLSFCFFHVGLIITTGQRPGSTSSRWHTDCKV